MQILTRNIQNMRQNMNNMEISMQYMKQNIRICNEYAEYEINIRSIIERAYDSKYA